MSWNDERKKAGPGAKLGEVTLVQGCMICKEEVILMATRNQMQPLPEKGTCLPEVCTKCREKYLKEGILLINPNNGKLAVIKEEAFDRLFTEMDNDMHSQIKRLRIAFTEDAVLDKITGGKYDDKHNGKNHTHK